MDETSTPDENDVPLTDWESDLLDWSETSPGRDSRFGADFVTYFDE